MDKVVISVLLTVLVGGAAVGGIYFLSAGGADKNAGEPEAVTQLRVDLQTTREAVTALETQVKKLAARQGELASARAARPEGTAMPAVAVSEDGEPAAGVSSGMRDTVFALIAEERTLREEERKQQREAAEKRREEQRKEIEELSKGPYDRLNLKINSMAKALAMDDTQREKYFEITKKYRDKIDAERQALFAQARERMENAKQNPDQAAAQPGAQPGAPGGPGGRGNFGRESFEKVRELMEATQKDYATEVQGILTAPQVATFNELSQSSQSFMGGGMAVKEGEDDGGAGGGRFGDMLRGVMGGGQTKQRGAQGGPGGRTRG